MKERVVDKKYDPLVWLGAKIGLRNKDTEARVPAKQGKAGHIKRPA